MARSASTSRTPARPTSWASNSTRAGRRPSTRCSRRQWPGPTSSTRTISAQCAYGQTPDAPDGINCNYKGKTNEFVADWVATLAYDYRRPINSSLEFRFGFDVYYTTETFVNPTLDERQKQDAYAKLNARVAIGSENWEVAVLGRNLTDEEIYPYGNDTPLAATTFRAWSAWRFMEPAQTVALQANVRF